LFFCELIWIYFNWQLTCTMPIQTNTWNRRENNHNSNRCFIAIIIINLRLFCFVLLLFCFCFVLFCVLYPFVLATNEATLVVTFGPFLPRKKKYIFVSFYLVTKTWLIYLYLKKTFWNINNCLKIRAKKLSD
jgi:hypothetical protein